MAARLRHGGILHLNHKLLATFLYKNVQKAFSLRRASPPDLPSGALPWTLLGGSAPRPRLGSRSARSPWSAPSPFGKSWIRHCSNHNAVVGCTLHIMLYIAMFVQIELMNASVAIVIVGDEQNISLSWTTDYPPVLLTDELSVSDKSCNNFGRVALLGNLTPCWRLPLYRTAIVILTQIIPALLYENLFSF